jgi:hypothetical protein
MKATSLPGRLAFALVSICALNAAALAASDGLPDDKLNNLGASELEERLRQSVIAMVNEPAQKLIIIFDESREDMVWQARCEGSSQPFGWIIPVPSRPEVKQGSMECFYDVSRATDEPLWPEEYDESSVYSSSSSARKVKRVKIPTNGAVEWTIIGPSQTDGLDQWLDSNHFSLPKATRSAVESHKDKGWYVVAAKINPGPAANTNSPVELPPLVISFPTDKCVASLALSTGTAEPARASIFVVSSEPRMSRAVFDQKFRAYVKERAEWIKNRPLREKDYDAQNQQDQAVQKQFAGGFGGANRSNPLDPADPPPAAVVDRSVPNPGPYPPFSESDDDFYGQDFLGIIEILGANVPAVPKFPYDPAPEHLEICAQEFPRLAGKDYALTKETETLSPEQMCGMEFEPALPLFAAKLHTVEGRTLIRQLPRFGARAVPLLLNTAATGDGHERRLATSAMSQISDKRLTPALGALLGDPDTRIVMDACQCAIRNWDVSFAPQLGRLLTNADPRVRRDASTCLQFHAEDSARNVAVYQRIAAEGGPGASEAAFLLRRHGMPVPASAVLPMLVTPSPQMLHAALGLLRDRQLEITEIMPLLTNSSAPVRENGLFLLIRRRDKPAAEQMVKMLRDSDEGVRWTARQNLRMLSGQKLGADPAAWEKWWAANKDTFTPAPRVRPQAPDQARPLPNTPDLR